MMSSQAQTDLFADGMFVPMIPMAPQLAPHQWPFPGMTPEDSARSALSMSATYSEVVAMTIAKNASGMLTSKQILSLVPQDWRDLLGRWAHGDLPPHAAIASGITKSYVHHDGGGFHYEYGVDAAIALQAEEQS